MPKIIRIIALFAALVVVFETHAQTQVGDPFPAIGSYATFSAVAQVLNTAPLPSLDGGRWVITPQVGTMKVSAHNDHAAERDILNPGYRIRTYGEATGHNLGLTVAAHATTNLSFFLSTGFARLKGEFSQTMNDAIDHRLNNFEGESTAGVLGIHYRLIGSDDSIFALGIFTGPTFYTTKMNGNIQNVNRGPEFSEMKFTPSGSGQLFGLQMMFRIGGVRINPYFKLIADGSDMCKDVKFSGGAIQANDYACEGTRGRIIAPAFAGGYGLLAGWKSFLVSVYSSSDNMGNLKPSSLSLSYGIKL